MKFIQRLSFLTVFSICVTSLYAQDIHYNYDHTANFGAYRLTNGSTSRARAGRCQIN